MAQRADSAFRSRDWWRGATIYEVCVRSFRDSNRDGQGDLPGLIAGLGDLAPLGIDAIWLTPVSQSPNFDSGYDVSDYMSIEPAFGTMEDFPALVAGVHARGLKVVPDQVCSHASHLHPWFIESAASCDDPRADWYVWANPRPDGGPPNNWLGRFGGYAREWSAARRQYYLHNFLIEQPDLNLHNPEVQEAILHTMRHWFDPGVDGLRPDVVNFYMQDPSLRDNPPVLRNDTPAIPYYLQSHVHDRSRPENLPFVVQMRAEADLAGYRMLLGEISCDWQTERVAEYTRPGLLHTASSFELLGPTLSDSQIARTDTMAGAGDGWPCRAFSNHDVVRVTSRWGAVANPARIRMLQAMLLCLRGPVVLYQSEELGLPHSDVPRHRLQDPEVLRFWPNHRDRDGARTPVPWTDQGVSLGFSDVDGGLPTEPDHAAHSIRRQETDPLSPLAHARAMLAFRRSLPALQTGDWHELPATETALVFRRSRAGESLICAFDFAEQPLALPFDGLTLAGVVASGMIAADGNNILQEQP